MGHRGNANKPYGNAFDKVYRRALTGQTPTWNCVAYSNPKRRWLFIQSAAAEEVEVGFGSDTDDPHTGFLLCKPSAIANDAIIRPSFEFSSELGNLTTQAVWARSASGGVAVIIGESDADDVPAAPSAGISSSSSSTSSSSSHSASSVSASSASSPSSDNSSESNSSRSASSASTVSASSRSASSRSASSVSASSASTVSTSSYSSVSASSRSASSSSDSGP